MCGIAGIYKFDGDVPFETIRAMTELLAHRGPDDHGYACFHTGSGKFAAFKDTPPSDGRGFNLLFGHRRLSILDLSEAGRQPFFSDDGRYCMVFNGEIYNYLELEEELRSKGRAFHTKCDTEVILAAYQEWSEECLSKFNGMWAFAIWDRKERELFCARDRFGVKPFYYLHDGNRFIFASEIKSILEAAPEERKPHYPYLLRFVENMTFDDGQETFFANVRQLLPAHKMRVFADGSVRISEYWDMPEASVRSADEMSGAPDDEVFERTRELLTDAVRLRFRSDVPVGTCLSGGLDSSSIVALAAKSLKQKINTFSVEYQEKEFSEGEFARHAAALFADNAHFLTPKPENYFSVLEKFSWHHDEPCAGPGPWSQWHVMELASKHVKVVLDGQGADEQLGGYHYYFDSYLTSVWGRVCRARGPLLAWPEFKAERARINALTGGNYTSSTSYLLAKKILEKTPGPLKAVLRRAYRHRADQDSRLGRVLSDEAARAHPVFMRELPSKYKDPLNDALYRDLRWSLPSLLQYEDRTSMAFSIESRVPFLDFRLVEFLGGLSYNQKIRGDTTKYALRGAMKGILPDEITFRKDKKGFPTPFAVWLRGPLYEGFKDIFNSSSFLGRGIFNREGVASRLEAHREGRGDYSWLLWRAANTELWFRKFIDNP